MRWKHRSGDCGKLVGLEWLGKVTKETQAGEKGSVGFEIARSIMLFWYKWMGWKIIGELPKGTKAVIVAAPHTSNWDLPFMLAVAMNWRVKIHWMGKDSIFKAPFGGLMRWLGGVSIDRSSKNNVVDQMVAEFNRRETFVLAVAPEGTRSGVKRWKTGFYHIADQAQVPIVLGFLDYEKKIGGIAQTLETSGDCDLDLVEIKKFYRGVKGKHPEQGEVH